MKFQRAYLKSKLSYVSGTILLSLGSIYTAKRLMPHVIYEYWILVGAPTLICGAVLAVRASLRKRDPEEWGIPVSRIFLATIILYFVVCLSQAYAIPFVQSQFPEIAASIGRLKDDTDLHVGSSVDPMVDAQKEIVQYGQDKANAEAVELHKGFAQLLVKKQNGTFGPEDQAQEDRLLAEYASWQANERKLQATALGHSETPLQTNSLPLQTSRLPLNSTRQRTAQPTPDVKPSPYINLLHFGPESGTRVALAITSESKDSDWPQILASGLRDADSSIDPNAFNMAQMEQGGVFGQIWQGDRQPLQESGASSHFRYVLLIRAEKTCGPINVAGNNLTSCHVSIQSKAFDHTGETVMAKGLQSSGVGFSETTALQVAVQHIMPDAKTAILEPLKN